MNNFYNGGDKFSSYLCLSTEDANDETDEDFESHPLHRVPVPLSELPETTTVLERDGCRVYLIGTAHFSKESQDDVVKVRIITILPLLYHIDYILLIL